MEAEVRAILRDTLKPAARTGGLGSQIHARFAAAGGAELELPARSDKPRTAAFEK
jgi:antitoxin FitA